MHAEVTQTHNHEQTRTSGSKLLEVRPDPRVSQPGRMVESRPNRWRRRLPKQKCSTMWKISTGLSLLPNSGSSSMIRSMSTLAWMKSPSVLRFTVPLIPIRQCSCIRQNASWVSPLKVLYHTGKGQGIQTAKHVDVKHKCFKCSIFFALLNYPTEFMLDLYRIDQWPLCLNAPQLRFTWCHQSSKLACHITMARKSGGISRLQALHGKWCAYLCSVQDRVWLQAPVLSRLDVGFDPADVLTASETPALKALHNTDTNISFTIHYNDTTSFCSQLSAP